jgi:hypothetical protein
MLRFLALDLVMDQMHDLIAMLFEKASAQIKISGWHLVVNSLTCRATLLMCIRRRLRSPLPAAFAENRATVHAYGWLRQLAARHVWIVYVFLDQPVMPAASGNVPLIRTHLSPLRSRSLQYVQLPPLVH